MPSWDGNQRPKKPFFCKSRALRFKTQKHIANAPLCWRIIESAFIHPMKAANLLPVLLIACPLRFVEVQSIRA
jgi:hypothetical protein